MLIYTNMGIQKNIKKIIALEISETYLEQDNNDDIIPFILSITENIWLDDFGVAIAT